MLNTKSNKEDTISLSFMKKKKNGKPNKAEADWDWVVYVFDWTDGWMDLRMLKAKVTGNPSEL